MFIECRYSWVWRCYDGCAQARDCAVGSERSGKLKCIRVYMKTETENIGNLIRHWDPHWTLRPSLGIATLIGHCDPHAGWAREPVASIFRLPSGKSRHDSVAPPNPQTSCSRNRALSHNPGGGIASCRCFKLSTSSTQWQGWAWIAAYRRSVFFMSETR